MVRWCYHMEIIGRVMLGLGVSDFTFWEIYSCNLFRFVFLFKKNIWILDGATGCGVTCWLDGFVKFDLCKTYFLFLLVFGGKGRARWFSKSFSRAWSLWFFWMFMLCMFWSHHLSTESKRCSVKRCILKFVSVKVS